MSSPGAMNEEPIRHIKCTRIRAVGEAEIALPLYCAGEISRVNQRTQKGKSRSPFGCRRGSGETREA